MVTTVFPLPLEVAAEDEDDAVDGGIVLYCAFSSGVAMSMNCSMCSCLRLSRVALPICFGIPLYFKWSLTSFTVGS